MTEFQGGPSPAANGLFKNTWTGKDIEIEMNSVISSASVASSSIDGNP